MAMTEEQGDGLTIGEWRRVTGRQRLLRVILCPPPPDPSAPFFSLLLLLLLLLSLLLRYYLLCRCLVISYAAATDAHNPDVALGPSPGKKARTDSEGGASEGIGAKLSQEQKALLKSTA
eukprot:754747-Hanusia_phi.AAC.2